MRKILIITPNCPFPPYKSGGTHALYNIIKNKIDDDYIDLVYYHERDIEAEIEVNKYVNNIIYIPIKKRNNKLIRITSILRGIPFGIYQYDSKKVIINEKYDLVIFDQNLSLDLVNYVECKKKILMAYDSMQLYFERKSNLSYKLSIEGIYNYLQSIFYKKIKRNLYKKFNKIFFVSNVDSKYESELHKENEDIIDYINLGVDSSKFNRENYIVNNEENSIIFTGIMDYAPNKDAVIFFIKNIMPGLLKKYPDLKFYIVGKNPDEDIKKLESKNVIVTGFVDDIVEYIVKSKIYISPLRFGTGMKNKILEAMSSAKPIVASSISIEGIEELKNNENIFICDQREEWINAIDILLSDSKLREEFSEKCREIVLNNYSWKKAYINITNI